MREAFFMMLLAVVCSNAEADWVEVNRDEISTIYADPTTIRRAGDIVKMWSVFDYKKAETTSDGKPYMSSRSQERWGWLR